MNVILAILVFGFIIFIHELGHFYFAKKAGVTIHEFSIGMGPKIFGKEKNGTAYTIRLLPIGGFVAMEGEDEDSNDPNAFGEKTLLQRLSSILAGPFANIILCVILLIPVYFITGTPSTTVSNVLPNSPAHKVGLKVDDKILSINNKNISSFDQLTATVQSNKNKEMSLEVLRGVEKRTFKITPALNQGSYQIGVAPKLLKSASNIGNVVVQSVKTTYKVGVSMLQFLWKLVTGQLGGKILNSVAGPVGVIKLVSTQAENGLINLVYFAAIISLNIGIFNLLPIPALDGWRVLILIIEGIRGGKKIPAKIEGYINGIGLVVLLSFMVFITYKDILKLL